MLSIFSAKSNIVVNACGVIVGKLVKNLGVINYFATVCTAEARFGLNICSLIRSHGRFSEQVSGSFAQACKAFLTDVSRVFYTFPTGPTNTTNLNKGI